jgi:hypothetical protein
MRRRQRHGCLEHFQKSDGRCVDDQQRSQPPGDAGRQQNQETTALPTLAATVAAEGADRNRLLPSGRLDMPEITEVWFWFWFWRLS